MARGFALEALEQTAVPVAHALAALGPALVDDREARAGRTEAVQPVQARHDGPSACHSASDDRCAPARLVDARDRPRR